MPEAKGGLFITFEPARREILQQAANAQDKFSVELSASDWHLARKEMFLVSFSDDKNLIDGAAIGRRKGGPRNTGGFNIEFSGFVFFPHLSISSLLQKLSKGARSTIKEREGSRGKWFPPVAWGSLLELLKKSRPQVADALNELWARVNAGDELENGNQIQRLALQRDAIGLSLDIAGLPELRRKEFRKIHTADTDVQSFIALMDAQPPQERMLIDHDRNLIEGVVAKGQYESATFSEGPRQLKVWTVDKGPVERFTGVDLVILNQDYNSLLLIQYKCMEHVGVGPGKQWRYRPDEQFAIEEARMTGVQELIKKRTPTKTRMEDIRLNRAALYFKFCKRLPLSQQDGELAEGMLMSLSTTQTFFTSNDSLGKNGGRYIGYENCERYLSNSLFVALARDGWIGSRGLTDQHYQEVLGLIHKTEDRSLVIAETRTSIASGQDRASRRTRTAK